MGGLLNTTYHDTVDKITEFNETLVNNSFYTLNDKKPIIGTYFNINKDDLASNKRSNDIAYPRQIAMYLCRDIANMSYPQIGIDFGGRDHSTVMSSCEKIKDELKTNNQLVKIIDEITKKLS